MFLRDTLRLPARGLRPSAHPFSISLLAHACGYDVPILMPVSSLSMA